METITFAEVEADAQEQILAPNSHHHVHATTQFAWS